MNTKITQEHQDLFAFTPEEMDAFLTMSKSPSGEIETLKWEFIHGKS